MFSEQLFYLSIVLIYVENIREFKKTDIKISNSDWFTTVPFKALSDQIWIIHQYLELWEQNILIVFLYKRGSLVASAGQHF